MTAQQTTSIATVTTVFTAKVVTETPTKTVTTSITNTALKGKCLSVLYISDKRTVKTLYRTTLMIEPGASCSPATGQTGGGCSNNCYCDQRTNAAPELGVCNDYEGCGSPCQQDSDCAANEACATGPSFSRCNGAVQASCIRLIQSCLTSTYDPNAPGGGGPGSGGPTPGRRAVRELGSVFAASRMQRREAGIGKSKARPDVKAEGEA